MKKLFPILLLILSLACAKEKSPSTLKYKEVVEGQCRSNSANIYHYSLPEEKSGKIPLLIILDSGGDGKMAVNKMLPAVSQFPIFLIGSDLIRNNFTGYELAIRELIEDAVRKYLIDQNQIYLAGFSGGARIAFNYAQKYPVKGVLMCGAGPNIKSFNNLPCPVYMIAGTTDFNFSEMFYNPLKVESQKDFMADYFRGSHEWPPSKKIKDGLLYLMGESIPSLKKIKMDEARKLSLQSDSLLAANEIFFVYKALEKALIFSGESNKIKSKIEELKKNKELQKAFSNIESDMTLENKLKQAYYQVSTEKDSVWWANELTKLNGKIEKSIGDKKDHYLRIKGFFGILFYSRLNQLVHSQPNNKIIEHLLAAYKMAEPDNPDAYYFSALYAMKQGRSQESRKDLSYALSLGFSNKVMMEGDFPKEFLEEMNK